MNAATDLLNKIIKVVLNPIMLVIFATGFLLFVYGFFEYMRGLNAGENNDKRKYGQQHMIWGVVGMLIMVSFNGIIALIDNTFGFNPGNPDVSNLNSPPGNFFSN